MSKRWMWVSMIGMPDGAAKARGVMRKVRRFTGALYKDDQKIRKRNGVIYTLLPMIKFGIDSTDRENAAQTIIRL